MLETTRPVGVATYDHRGRRVRRQTFTWDSTTWSSTASSDTKYVYDGWRVIEELDGLNSNAVTRKHTWGADLSGSIEGAGGIGGLLAAYDVSGTPTPYIYLYDANGNVGQVMDGSTWTTATTAAQYEYSLYGSRLNTPATGEYDQPYRFSTKPFDLQGVPSSAPARESNTGLGYWGYRYYNPNLGRWLGRDPIEEVGGMNVYGYIQNSPVLGVDAYGMIPIGYVTPWDGDSPNPTTPISTPAPAPTPPNVVKDPKRINCARYALGAGCAIFPGKNTSVIDIARHYGYECTLGVSSNRCCEYCACSEYAMAYVYIKDMKQYGPYSGGGGVDRVMETWSGNGFSLSKGKGGL